MEMIYSPNGYLNIDQRATIPPPKDSLNRRNNVTKIEKMGCSNSEKGYSHGRRLLWGKTSE